MDHCTAWSMVYPKITIAKSQKTNLPNLETNTKSAWFATSQHLTTPQEGSKQIVENGFVHKPQFKIVKDLYKQ